MSGLYLTLYDKNSKNYDDVLKPTSGGYPHITCFYSGKNIPREKLVELMDNNNKNIVFDIKEVVIEKGEINSWGVRHDVLLMIRHDERLTSLRNSGKNVGKIYPMGGGGFHTTVGIYHKKEDAEKHLKSIEHLLPLTVKITGFTLE